MPYTHYPKLSSNIIFAWVWPRPPAAEPFYGSPPFDKLNRMAEPLAADAAVVGYHEAQGFTRFYGTIASDQPLDVSFRFSNDEVAPDGHWVNDENLALLNYDGWALRQAYEPGKQEQTGKYLVTIYGRWLRVQIRNMGVEPATFCRVYVRGSVF
jgi:hypothetical protein